jgi:predicted DNA-binding transcriptional regulator AlpA
MSQETTVTRVELLDVEEAADWCRISPNTLNDLRTQRRFAPAIKVGKRLFWPPADLNTWLEDQREVLM